jgi:HemY protein
LRDRETRARHLQAAQAIGHAHHQEAVAEVMDAAYLSAARWALSDRDAPEALRWLDGLRQGPARRTLTLRMRLKAARLSRQHDQALDTARQLVKHGAFMGSAATALVRELTIAALNEAHDVAQLQRAWQSLGADERAVPEVSLHAAQRLLRLGGTADAAMTWLTPLWNRMVQEPESCSPAMRERIVSLLADVLSQLPADAEWLASIERARQAYPRWSEMQFLAGTICWHHGLWGKAQQLLEAVVPQLQHAELQRQSWRILALLAEQKEDTPRAHLCWKRAAEVPRT